ncbi:hypothetical protein PR048_013963 [Dryococelus australis]|uniref:Uncharacterized protein n=1 Tax=Dryococelus australis TaxID=614101 RepID=A0ABQ9HTM2_9NEOP|nr:hypothetical protein PR048_013963 [Dryococelus australis]
MTQHLTLGPAYINKGTLHWVQHIEKRSSHRISHQDQHIEKGPSHRVQHIQKGTSRGDQHICQSTSHQGQHIDKGTSHWDQHIDRASHTESMAPNTGTTLYDTAPRPGPAYQQGHLTLGPIYILEHISPGTANMHEYLTRNSISKNVPLNETIISTRTHHTGTSISARLPHTVTSISIAHCTPGPAHMPENLTLGLAYTHGHVPLSTYWSWCGLSKFYALRPRWVKTQPEEVVCPCIYCSNLKLICVALQNITNNKIEEEDLLLNCLNEDCWPEEHSDCPSTETLTVESLGLGEEEEEVKFAIWEHGDLIRKSVSIDNFLKDVRHWTKKAIPHSYIRKIQMKGIAEAKISV